MERCSDNAEEIIILKKGYLHNSILNVVCTLNHMRPQSPLCHQLKKKKKKLIINLIKQMKSQKGSPEKFTELYFGPISWLYSDFINQAETFIFWGVYETTEQL